MPYVRTVTTSSGATAVQIVYSSLVIIVVELPFLEEGT